MDPSRRTLAQGMLIADDRADTAQSVERLTGTKPEARFAFIQERAEFASHEMLDVGGWAEASQSTRLMAETATGRTIMAAARRLTSGDWKFVLSRLSFLLQ
jgi:hypothetical protein